VFESGGGMPAPRPSVLHRAQRQARDRDLTWPLPDGSLPAKPWTGIRDATAFRVWCVQSGVVSVRSSEDCLYPR
jgi:hypothetical protein